MEYRITNSRGYTLYILLIIKLLRMEGIRTLGDGMDNLILTEPLKTDLNTVYVDDEIVTNILKSMKPVKPKSNIFKLVPKYVPKERKVPKFLIKKPREPKFIPYEPYKAAVIPIMKTKYFQNDIIDAKTSKNNVEIQKLAKQMTEMRRVEMNEVSKVVEEKEDVLKLKLKWENEKEAYETDIKNLRETNSHLENQLKFQAQVNSELKTLLVAAVGEDLESRVQHLTEDKLSLARALLNSTDHLTSHQEQTEWLSGQCEVWRSKFLASSLMVEELAKWKSALTNRMKDLQNVTKTLLEEYRQVHIQSIKTFNSLKALVLTVSDKKNKVSSICGNLIEVSKANHELAEFLETNLNVKDHNVKKKVSDEVLLTTVTERKAVKLLQNPVTISKAEDTLCNAVMGAAISMSGQQIFLQNTSMHNCCAHCKGEMQEI